MRARPQQPALERLVQDQRDSDRHGGRQYVGDQKEQIEDRGTRQRQEGGPGEWEAWMPDGLPMAGRGDDRDRLRLDGLHLRPGRPSWPASC